MKENTILLELEHYNRLRDFEKEVLKGKLFRVDYTYNGNEIYYYITKDEALSKSNDNITALNDEVKRLKCQIEDLIKPRVIEEEKIHKSLKELLMIEHSFLKTKSIWQFLKWRRTQNK